MHSSDLAEGILRCIGLAKEETEAIRPPQPRQKKNLGQPAPQIEACTTVMDCGIGMIPLPAWGHKCCKSSLISKTDFISMQAQEYSLFKQKYIIMSLHLGD